MCSTLQQDDHSVGRPHTNIGRASTAAPNTMTIMLTPEQFAANINVVNRHHRPQISGYPKCNFYIGRGSPLGNRWSHLANTQAQFMVSTRDEACDQYALWLDVQMRGDAGELGRREVQQMVNEIGRQALTGPVYLICFCSPQRCHGDEIKRWLVDCFSMMCLHGDGS